MSANQTYIYIQTKKKTAKTTAFLNIITNNNIYGAGASNFGAT